MASKFFAKEHFLHFKANEEVPEEELSKHPNWKVYCRQEFYADSPKEESFVSKEVKTEEVKKPGKHKRG